MATVINMLGGASGGLKPQIIVTAPTGSTVTCDGVTGTEVSGTWTFTTILGTHTIVATRGSSRKTASVAVDKIAQYTLNIEYETYLYNEGSECESITDGWTGYAGYYSTVTKNNDNLNITAKHSSYNGSWISNNLIDFSNYTKICVEYTINQDQRGATRIVDEKSSDPNPWTYQTYYNTGTHLTSEHSLVASELTGAHYACVSAWGLDMTSGTTTNLTVYKIWLE